MKTTAKTDVAKYFCGFESYHAIASAGFWLSGMSVTLLGVTWTPTWGIAGLVIHGIIAVALAVYAWGGKPAIDRAQSGMGEPRARTFGVAAG